MERGGLKTGETTGSGTLIKLNNQIYILTNYHVVSLIDDPFDVKVKIYDGRTIKIESLLLPPDEANDLALLKVVDSKNLPTAIIATEDQYRRLSTKSPVYYCGTSEGRKDVHGHGPCEILNKDATVGAIKDALPGDVGIKHSLEFKDENLVSGHSGSPLFTIIKINGIDTPVVVGVVSRATIMTGVGINIEEGGSSLNSKEIDTNLSNYAASSPEIIKYLRTIEDILKSPKRPLIDRFLSAKGIEKENYNIYAQADESKKITSYIFKPKKEDEKEITFTVTEIKEWFDSHPESQGQPQNVEKQQQKLELIKIDPKKSPLTVEVLKGAGITQYEKYEIYLNTMTGEYQLMPKDGGKIIKIKIKR